MQRADPVLVFDLDGTVLRLNSFPVWVLFLALGGVLRVRVRQQMRITATVVRLLVLRKFGRIGHPELLRNMQELFLVEAEKYNVFPLDNSFAARAATPRPSATAGKTVFTYSGESSGLPYSDAPDITGKSYSITAEVEIPQGGAEGMINTLGGRAGGHGLYLLKSAGSKRAS